MEWRFVLLLNSLKAALAAMPHRVSRDLRADIAAGYFRD